MNRVLLIVDDCQEIARGLRRCLKHCFDAVYIAGSVKEAEEHLARGEGAPTHLLCDHYLGDGQAVGIELVPRWRRAYPGLVLAAIFSGSELRNPPQTLGIDRFFRKPLDVDALVEFFRPTRTSAP